MIGDLPFFVSPTRATSGHAEFFLLDEKRQPASRLMSPTFSVKMGSSGVTVYDWDALRDSGYRWCISRLRSLLAHVEVID